MSLERLPHAGDPERRLFCFTVAADRLVNRQPVKRVAADWDVSARSVKRWTAALRHDGPLAERLRAAAGMDGGRRRNPSAP